MHAVPGMVEGVSTRPTVDFTGLHVTIPAQPVTVAYGVITSYIVSVERYSSGDHQSTEQEFGVQCIWWTERYLKKHPWSPRPGVVSVLM